MWHCSTDDPRPKADPRCLLRLWPRANTAHMHRRDAPFLCIQSNIIHTQIHAVRYQVDVVGHSRTRFEPSGVCLVAQSSDAHGTHVRTSRATQISFRIVFDFKWTVLRGRPAPYGGIDGSDGGGGVRDHRHHHAVAENVTRQQQPSARDWHAVVRSVAGWVGAVWHANHHSVLGCVEQPTRVAHVLYFGITINRDDMHKCSDAKPNQSKQ